ncbi:hypothetical protein IWW38_004767 [Coemansia aciculifera]|uniref:Uncharacterized protein n=1 Tax=Coemansia aciculifera TaxID=417176 RepID=A0ACC1LYG3_9FUNG|nr:hypothetical protein IWW38_004767 [Coemansia aciculifera]
MTNGSTSKRVRFSENGNSATRELNLGNGSYSSADEYDSDVNAELEANISSSRRRGRHINIDGYGSDASEQDEVANLSDYSDDQDEEADAKDDDEQADDSTKSDTLAMDEDDMFMDNAAGSSEQQTEKSKRKRFLELDDIEGQEMDSATRTEDMAEDFSASRYGKGKEPERTMDDDDDDENEPGRGRITIEAFNMKEDFEEGKFDASGNFVWNKQDPHAYQDEWINNVSESAMALARESKAKQSNGYLHTHGANEDERRWDAASDDDIVVEILNVLNPRETVLAALARIGGPKKKSKNKWASKKGKAATGVEEADGGKEVERKRAIENLTVLADQAMVRGMVNIYEDTYEQLVRQMRVAGRIPDDWVVGTQIQSSTAPNVVATSELLEDLDEL